MSQPVPVEDLVDLASLREDGRPPTPSQIRAALPAGWVLDADGRTARRDLRVLARDGWVLLLGLVSFGAAGIGLFWATFPAGIGGVLKLAGLCAALLLVGGFVAPMVTRALHRRG